MKSQDNQDLTSILSEFPFKAPDEHWYEVEEFKRNMLAVWLCNNTFWLFKNERGHRTIHSFYDTKKKQWLAPGWLQVGSRLAPSGFNMAQVDPEPIFAAIYGIS